MSAWLLCGLWACTEEPPPAPAPVATAAPSASVAAPAPKPRPAPPPPPKAFLPALINLGPVPTPKDNALSDARIALGKQLFFDPRLGKNGKASCTRCHDPAKGFGDGRALSKKPSGKANTRHTPTLYNVGYQTSFGWDGRHTTLEAHVAEEWREQLEADVPARMKAIAAVPGYATAFERAYGGPPDADRVAKALASYVRTIRSGNAPFDRWERGDAKAISESAQRGWKLFRIVGCTSCHAPPYFTDHNFHNAGVGYEKGARPDPGRRGVSRQKRDSGKMKTPALRSVTRHPPHFHDGHAAELVDAVRFMAGGGRANPHKDDGLTKVQMNEGEERDVLAFLASLDGAPRAVTAPDLP